MTEHTPTPGVWTGQISIAPRYHGELLTEAEQSGRTLENIMASRVEAYSTFKATNKALLGALRDLHGDCQAHGILSKEEDERIIALIAKARAQEGTA